MIKIYIPDYHDGEENILEESWLGLIIGHYALQAEKVNGQSYFKKVQLYNDSDYDSEDEGPYRDSDGFPNKFYHNQQKYKYAKKAKAKKDLAIWSDGHHKWFIGEDHLKKENYGNNKDG